MTEQQPYEVVHRYPGFEVRRYPRHVVAEVSTTGPFERAGNAGFGPLVSYISGRNRDGRRIAMTAPVIQEPLRSDAHRVSFVMPAGTEVATLPAPSSAGVTLHEVEESYAAVVRYSGRWTESGYARREAELLEEIARAGLVVAGRPRYARFDPPWTPPFLRRNEVVVPVEAP
jgi:hypothetical protein